jgi:hypothetical protein
MRSPRRGQRAGIASTHRPPAFKATPGSEFPLELVDLATPPPGSGQTRALSTESDVSTTVVLTYPRLVEASGRCPPEDVGGPWGYGEMLEAIADPEHERHAEICEWLGEEYDPNAFDAAARQAEVASLAKRWSRRPPTKTPSAL